MMDELEYHIRQGLIDSQVLCFSVINYSALSNEEHINQPREKACATRKQCDKHPALSEADYNGKKPHAVLVMLLPA